MIILATEPDAILSVLELLFPKHKYFRMKILIVVLCVGAEFFPKDGDEAAEVLIGKILAHFLQCIQFNMHMVDSVFR